MGTIISFGTGKALVIATGMNTKFGHIADLTANTKKDLSPLQKELTRIGIFVGKITLVISMILFSVGIIFQGKHFVESLLFAASVAVAAVPEGLPATITIALALGVQKLAKKNAIIKELASVETLGSTTVICSDKTGTLTQNQMTAKEIFTMNYHVNINGVGYSPEGELQIIGVKEYIEVPSQHKNHASLTFISQTFKKTNPDIYQIIKKITQVGLLCNNAKIIRNEQNQYECLGDPTEGALLTLGEKAGFSLDQMNKEFPKIKEFPFSSDRKMMSTVHKKDSDFIIFVKGAPDQVLKKCSKYLNQKGETKKITPKIKEIILNQNNEMASRALRVLALSYKEEPELKNLDQKEIEDKLIFVGLIGIIDPPREEVKKAVELTQKAGIKTYIITGDYGLTASAIAYELGIIKSKNPKIITGDVLNKLTESDLLKQFKKYPDLIFARVNPEHKLKIVSALKKRGEIVAVTGDGVNDAPALKRADIGVSMGITGTDVSKEAANMVLADDSFASIVTAIQEGRTIYENLKKFIHYVFSSNIGELVTVFAAILLALPSPLTAILILCINLGTDIFPALALGVEPTEEKFMNIPPRDPKSHIMNRKFIARFFGIGLFIGVIVIGSFIYYLYRYDWQWGIKLEKESLAYLKASTIAFSLLVLIQMVNAFNSRSEKESIFKIGVFKNHWLIGAIALSILVLILMVEVPFIQELLHTTHLTEKEWIFVTAASLSVLIFEEIRKLIIRQSSS